MSNSTTTTRVSSRVVVLAMLVVALICAGGISYYASGSPDGLNKVAADEGFNASERDHDLAGSPVAGYETSGIDNPRLSKAVAGVLGVTVTLLLGAGLFLLVRRTAPTSAADAGQGRGQPHSGPHP